MRTRFLIHLTIVGCLFLTVAAQNAQLPAEQVSGTPSPATAGTPIPPSEVITQAEDAESAIRQIGAGISPDPATDSIEQELPGLSEEVSARLQEAALTVEGSSSLDELRGFEADWRALARRFSGWRSDLSARGRRLEADLRQLDELAARWQGTLDEARSTETPPELIRRIEEILQSASETRRSLTAQQARIVALQGRVAEQQTRVDEALRTISVRRETLRGQLLVRDSPPIWSGELWTGLNVGSRLNESLATQLDGLSAFAGRNREKLVIHILVFAGLAGLLFYLRRWAHPLAEANPDLRQEAAIIYLPVPTALVLAILFSSQIYPQTPQVLGAVFGAVALVPTVVILRRLVGAGLYPLLYALVAFYFVDQVLAVSDAVPAVSRPLFIAEMIASFVFFLWFYRTTDGDLQDNAEPLRERFLRVSRFVSVAALPFFAVALLANVVGYVGLSRLIGGATLRSMYAALILYAGVRIVEGLVAFSLRFRPLNLLKMARDHAPEIAAAIGRVLRWVALALWVLITLEQFTLRETIISEGRALLTAELNLGSLSISAGDVLLFAIVVWAAFKLSRFLRFALEEDVYPRFALANGIPYAISTLVNYIVLLGGFFLAVGAAGIDLTRVTVLVGAFGVGIGFGLQNIFNNFISGLILLFERPIKVGDDIEIGQESGTVRRIGIRASRIRKWDNSEIIVPNSKLISENVRNWSFYARRRGLEIPVSVAHGTDAELIKRLWTETAAEHPLVLDKPPPQVVSGDVTSPGLTFRLRAWTASTDQVVTISTDLTLALSRKLAQNKIVVPNGPPHPPGDARGS